MYKIIDLDKWERAGNYAFFSKMMVPVASVTTEIDCTDIKQKSKEQGRSLYLLLLHSCLKAINNVEQLRYRILPSGDIALYDRIDVFSPIIMSEQGKLVEAHLRYDDDFESFATEAKEEIGKITPDMDTYCKMNAMTVEQQLGNVCISVVPDFYFTSLTATQSTPGGFSFNLVAVGKIVPRGNREVMPVSITFHHGFTDGYHIGIFARYFEQYLQDAIAR